jgi:hypothetical protein
VQQQTVDAHMAFLRVAEQSMRSLEAMLTMGATANGASPSPAQLAQPAIVQPPAPAAYAAPAPMHSAGSSRTAAINQCAPRPTDEIGQTGAIANCQWSTVNDLCAPTVDN